MGVHQCLLYGGVLAALSGDLVSALNTEILVPLFQFPNAEAGMWVDIREAAISGPPISGIMNPFNGPIADENSTAEYQRFLAEDMGIGDGATASDTTKPTIICYIATAKGDQTARPKDTVIAEIAVYDTLYPGVCSGIFFDEASSEVLTDSNGDLNTMGQLYFDYNEAALTAGKAVTFNPGIGADPEYFGWEGSPTVMSYENFYSLVEKAGVPRTSSSSTPDQNVMYMHTALGLETDASLVKATVEKATCSGWGKVYFTGSTFADDPWDEPSLFWDDLVSETSQDIDITCPDSAESQMRIMVPFLPNPVPSSADVTTMIAPLLAELSKSDFGDVVSVVLDASDATILESAVVLRDAGARVLCYLDADGFVETFTLSNMFESAYVGEVCGGFFLDNFDTTVIDELQTQNFYINAQFKIPGATIVYKPADASASTNAFLYENDWESASFQIGRVIVATVVDGATSTTIPPTPGARINSAVMMTGYSGNTAECVIADMAGESYGYAYVTEAADFATLSTFWATLVSETSEPSLPSTFTCSESPPTTASPTTAPPTTAPPTMGLSTPPPTTEPVVTACGDDEPVPTMQWFGGGRKLRIDGGGCADMTRIYNFLAGQQITGVLKQVEPGVWELEGTLNVRVGSILKIIGQELGECNELRLVTSSKPSRVFGNGGDIVIQDTKIYGWKDGAVDEVASETRGHILCRSCFDDRDAPSYDDPIGTGQCTMSVVDSTIGYLGYGTVSFGGLSWKDICETPVVATAQNVVITGNHRGIHARGAILNFDNIVVTGGNEESIRVDSCSGHVSSCTATPPTEMWGIVARRSPGIMITDNTMMGDKGMWLSLTDGLQVTGNTFTPSSKAVRVRTSNTVYIGNVGDGVYPGSDGDIGLRAQTDGCFTDTSFAAETAVNLHIVANMCT